VQRLLAACPDIDVIAGTVDDLVVESGRITGVHLPAGAGVVRPEPHRSTYPSTPADRDAASEPRLLSTSAVVLTTGTFMRGLMHTGERRAAGGRVGEKAAQGLSATLERLGFELGRLKTGTPPRLDAASIDWAALDGQQGDDEPVPFSDLTPEALAGGRFPGLPQITCHVTHTTPEAHALIRDNLHRAPMYSGQIEASSGPRYCPSIEDKVVRFAERPTHHVFLEPESLSTSEIYCNGISTSLPEDVQERLVHLMPGCERARILRFGYAVEYDMIWPHQIDSTCMAKHVTGLFPAGQINCTTGYEEAAGQGLLAGLNAARLAMGAEPLRLGREQAYIGVMLDDLVTKTPREPYRMFTSRAEHRLLLRADNADERLTPWGREVGLVDDTRWRAYRRRAATLDEIRARLDRCLVDGRPARALARRPETSVAEIATRLGDDVDDALVERVMTEARYEGYVTRQQAEVRRRASAESQRLPPWLDYASIPGLRAEAVEVLDRFRPATMGQAERLSGVNPADLTLLAVMIRRGDPARWAS
jgi:tRNA uridine 5-carboxymethylaminomethyl modification enzyme